jgi:hypothetical protein
MFLCTAVATGAFPKGGGMDPDDADNSIEIAKATIAGTSCAEINTETLR